MTDQTQDHFLSNKTYDVLKLIALIILPATGVAYAGLASIWGLPSAEEVLATIVVVDTFLGVIIKIGDKSYNASDAKYDGVVEAIPSGYHLILNGDPADIKDMKEVTFKVNPSE